MRRGYVLEGVTVESVMLVGGSRDMETRSKCQGSGGPYARRMETIHCCAESRKQSDVQIRVCLAYTSFQVPRELDDDRSAGLSLDVRVPRGRMRFDGCHKSRYCRRQRSLHISSVSVHTEYRP